MPDLVLPPDLDFFLTEFVRARMPALLTQLDLDPDDFDVVSDEHGDLPAVRVVIRDDGGTRESIVTFYRTVGVSVLAGTRAHSTPARDLARHLAGLLWSDEVVFAVGSPIAAVVDDDANGPYPIAEEQDRSRRYLTAGYRLLGDF